MHLRTPKRYRPGFHERRVVNTRWLWLWIIAPIGIVGGILLYNNRDELAPPIETFIVEAIGDVQGGVATMNAPTPMPTENPASRLARADESWLSGSIEQAVEDYLSASPSTPNMPIVFTRIALGYVMEGQYASAVEAAEDAVTADPYYADAWSVRGLALARDGQPAEGAASALQALALAPDDPAALAFLAEAYRLGDKINLALETAERAIEADPNRYEGYFVRAIINYNNIGEFETARADFAIARDLAPHMTYIATEMAWIEWQFDNTDLSMEMLQDVVENNPQNLDALYALGYFSYQYYGNPDTAIEYLSRCVAANGQNIPCLAYLAIVQATIGNTNDAIETYRSLLQTGTVDPRYYLRAGALMADSGGCTEALPILRQGYQLERSVDEPNTERLAVFESYLADCGAGGFTPPVEATEEAVEAGS